MRDIPTTIDRQTSARGRQILQVHHQGERCLGYGCVVGELVGVGQPGNYDTGHGVSGMAQELFHTGCMSTRLEGGRWVGEPCGCHAGSTS